MNIRIRRDSGTKPTRNDCSRLSLKGLHNMFELLPDASRSMDVLARVSGRHFYQKLSNSNYMNYVRNFEMCAYHVYMRMIITNENS